MARKTLTITLDLEGAALSEEWGDTEADEILTKARSEASRLWEHGEGWKVGAERPLFDSNGNRVGAIKVEER